MDDIEAIKQLKARYFRSMDTKDWSAMRDVFSEDIILDSSEAGGTVITGAANCISFLEKTLADVITVHHGHMPEIELITATAATGIWAMEDMLRWPNGSELHGYGHYHESYQKIDGRWHIRALKLTRLRTDMRPPTNPT